MKLQVDRHTDITWDEICSYACITVIYLYASTPHRYLYEFQVDRHTETTWDEIHPYAFTTVIYLYAYITVIHPYVCITVIYISVWIC